MNKIESSSNLKSVIDVTVEQLENYLHDARFEKSEVLQVKNITEIAQELSIEKYFQEGFKYTENIESFLKLYLKYSTNINNPNYIGHQVSVPDDLACIPELVHGIVNNPTTLYEMGQSGATLEHYVINWMLDKIGWFKGKNLLDFKDYPDGGSGFLTHGGSLANLTILCAARASICPEAWTDGNPNNLVVMGPESVHYSISRAMSIIGLGSNSYVPVPVDEKDILIADHLEETYKEVINQGKKVMLLVANACATATGYYDPIRKMGEFSRKHNIWFHVDGAHGTVALLTEKYKDYFDGIELADSLIWDAHKMLRTPALCTAVLFKKFKHQAQNFRQKGSYLFHEKPGYGKDTLPYTVECTKAPLGTKVYWAIALEGEKAMGKFIEECFDKARLLHKIVEEAEDFESYGPPQSNIVCYAYKPHLLSNKEQLLLRNKLIEQGKVYITSAELSGKRYLRSNIGNQLTIQKNFEFLLQTIRDLAKSLGY